MIRPPVGGTVTPVPINRPMVRDFLPNRNLIEDLQTIRPSRRVWLGAWVLSLLNWTLDVACLAASCAALGVHVSVPALLLTYTAGMAASSLTALPGGVGVVEAALILGLTTAGAPLAAALGAVLVYRVLSLGGVVVIGWGVLAVHRLRPSDPRRGGVEDDPFPPGGVRNGTRIRPAVPVSEPGTWMPISAWNGGPPHSPAPDHPHRHTVPEDL